MKGNCQDVATKLICIYTNAKVLGQVWNGIDDERRQESIDRLRARTVEISEHGQTRSLDANKFYLTLDKAEKLNSIRQETGSIYSARKGVIPDPIELRKLKNVLMDNALEMVIHAIADCECNVPLEA
ncbi:MAG TPA: hypothetical protein ENH69_02785 [Candidatus Aerophobetes bacterium]|uniref:Uncharacterized protein n=1 Tax=Aerophobetes bacterium TaxID=2030807 RepID=A0A7C1RXE1_UNCAE|nr:hypothetical protein [Candidatus Aerophobetes bacterium]